MGDTDNRGEARKLYAAFAQPYKNLSFLTEQIDLSNTQKLWTMKSVPADRVVVFWDEYETEVLDIQVKANV